MSGYGWVARRNKVSNDSIFFLLGQNNLWGLIRTILVIGVGNSSDTIKLTGQPTIKESTNFKVFFKLIEWYHNVATFAWNLQKELNSLKLAVIREQS